ncbi:Low-density lipoprotein receptor-related protein 8 [Frankliniella fusca]|uniref:Low-density lipoprotein receptor-related protein 8 n=1 Tax=Frankliniella fusca TaxID=407009 RepID=A0AAE1L6A8_9NEOP|nr:Low-density lipoprotein receptor-related protein 8 [Frankliniella fusca]
MFECAQGEFMCDMTRCIPKSHVCDEKVDCMDGTDELNCPEANEETNFALQLKGWRENMENFCGSKPPEGGCGSRQAQGFYPLWQPTASVFHGNRRFADCDPIAQFDRFDPRTTIGLPLEVRAVSRALDFLIPVSEALPQRGTRDSNPQPRVPTRSQNRKRPNAQSHRANGAAAKGNVKREKHFPEWESNFGPLSSVLRALPTEPRRHDDCAVRRVRIVFTLSPSLQPGGQGKYDANPSHNPFIEMSWRWRLTSVVAMVTPRGPRAALLVLIALSVLELIVAQGMK